MYGVYCMDYQYPVVQVSKRTVVTLRSFVLCVVWTKLELTCWFCRRTLLPSWASCIPGLCPETLRMPLNLLHLSSTIWYFLSPRFVLFGTCVFWFTFPAFFFDHLFVCRGCWTDSSAVLCKLVCCCVSHCFVGAHVTCMCDCSLSRRDAEPPRAAPNLLSSSLLQNHPQSLRQNLICHIFAFGGPERMCVGWREGWVWEQRSGLGTVCIAASAEGGGYIWSTRDICWPVCGVLEKTEAVWVRLKYFWSQVEDDVLWAVLGYSMSALHVLTSTKFTQKMWNVD